MIKFLDLQQINQQYKNELEEGFRRVLDSGWYIMGTELKQFETEFANYCGTKYAIGVANGLDALILIIRAYLKMGMKLLCHPIRISQVFWPFLPIIWFQFWLNPIDRPITWIPL